MRVPYQRPISTKQTRCAPLVFAILMAVSFVANAAPTTLGQDIPYLVLKDASGQLTLQEALSALDDLTVQQRETFSRGYVRDTFWLKFILPASAFNGQERWLELGPNFVDDIQLFYRPRGKDEPWRSRRTGDLLYGQADLEYRKPVFIVSPPDDESSGYDVLIRVQSTSAVLLQANLWQPAEFLAHAARATSFWSFYFGLTAISSLLALVLAVTLRSRLMWSVTAFSVSYLLVASVQGYLNWIFPNLGIPLQHYLTSMLDLVSFALLMWLCAETIDLRQHVPSAYKALIASCVMTLSLVVLVPLDLYGTAVKIKTGIFMAAVILFVGSICIVWIRNRFRFRMLLLSISPLVCIAAGLSALFSLLGWIAFRGEIYVVWQYAVTINMLLVMAIAVYRVWEKKLEEREKQQLVNELRIERDARFHQRQFMGMVAHEFRTPLAVISGSLENLYELESGGNNIRTVRYDKAQRATDRLVQLTDNCLADARLAADALYLDLQPVNLFELISSAASLVQLSDRHQLRVTMQGRAMDESTPACTVPLDAALIRIALSNIIDNAVKYASGGVIHIDCKTQGRWAVIRISDQGPGIGEQMAGQIFERYRRGIHSSQGAGLGLYVARQIAQAHGGDLRLVSNSSQGSCFELALPMTNELRTLAT